MPILDIEIVLRPNESLPPKLAEIIAEGVAAIFQSPPGGTWVKLRTIPADYYAENGAGQDDPPFPVFAKILKADTLQSDMMQAEITLLTDCLASACNRPKENVHIIYLRLAKGRISFGGNLLK